MKRAGRLDFFLKPQNIAADDGQRISHLMGKPSGKELLRFWNNEVLQNTNGVLEIIRDSSLSHPPLNPLPSREGKKSRASRYSLPL
jgi:hypothetical protein